VRATLQPLRPLLLVLAAATHLSLPAAAAAQEPAVPVAPAARPDDVASIDAIIEALYASISGPVGQPRDWDRLRSLVIPAAQLIPTGRRPDGSGAHNVLGVEEYIRGAGDALVAMGFRESEIARVTEQFGSIAHAFSSYEAYRGAEPTPFMRGINSIQLWHDGTRWWVVSIFWQQESPDQPIPAKYLQPGD
jgi:hypothetical protein